MKRKMLKRFVFKAFGFPIVLTNIPLIKLADEWIMDINYFELQRTVLNLLCHKQTPLTGNEIRFIREYCRMTLVEFGSVFGCSHVAALKWEKSGNHFAKMEPAIDLCIRFFVCERLQYKAKSFKSLYEQIKVQELAKVQKKRAIIHAHPMSIDLGEGLKATVNW